MSTAVIVSSAFKGQGRHGDLDCMGESDVVIDSFSEHVFRLFDPFG